MDFADQETTTITKVFYPSCTWHLDCHKKQFCSVRCWTGNCARGKANKGTRYCQPCNQCSKPADSVTRSCAVCKVVASSEGTSRGVKLDVNPFVSCTAHSDCGNGAFCAVKCRAGGCTERGKRGKCQPCTKCKKPFLSLTRSCDICEVSGHSSPWYAGACILKYQINYVAT